MITTGLAKLGTGLAARGFGLPLRMAAFAAVAWGEWRLLLLGREWIRTVAAPAAGIQDGSGAADVLTVLTLLCLTFSAIAALITGTNHRYRTPTRPTREAWRLRDFLRHAPFACWRLIANDGAPVWAILALPVILAVDLFIVVEVLFVILARGLWLALTFRFSAHKDAPKEGNDLRARNGRTEASTKRWIIWILGLALIFPAAAIPLGWHGACGVLGTILCVWAAAWAADD